MVYLKTGLAQKIGRLSSILVSNYPLECHLLHSGILLTKFILKVCLRASLTELLPYGYPLVERTMPFAGRSAIDFNPEEPNVDKAERAHLKHGQLAMCISF